MERNFFRITATVVVLLFACSDPSRQIGTGFPDGQPPDDSGHGDDTATPDDGGHQVRQLRGAPDVTIRSIALYQGPKCEIMVDGDPVECDVPIIEGRTALFRVFYEVDPSQVGRTYTGRLTINEESYQITETFAEMSEESDLLSTANFIVDGDAIFSELSYSVELLQEHDGAHNEDACFPAEGMQSLDVQGIRNTLRVILAPFAYWGDGSGRLPDLSPARVEEFRERFQQLYPVSNVEISVREPYDWDGRLDQWGNGWYEVGLTLLSFRAADGVSDDVYYYGIFNPTNNFYTYCMAGCLLGVTVLNDSPPDTGQVNLRLALGVGFNETAVGTCAHEIGHAHGRAHAPCGSPDGVDMAYPYAGGVTGVWNWDIINWDLIPPDYTDIMGYCDDQWISDYHYRLLYQRSEHVNLPRFYTPEIPPVRYQVIVVRGDGEATIESRIHRSHPLAGERLLVNASTAMGMTYNLEGQYFRFDHIPGGFLFVPEQASKLVAAEFFVNEQQIFAVRAP